MDKRKRHNEHGKGLLRYEAWNREISENERLEVKMWRVGNRVKKFSVVYLRKLKHRWVVIRRYDNAHAKPHAHIYGYTQGEIRIERLHGGPGMLLTTAIETIKKCGRQLTETYFQN